MNKGLVIFIAKYTILLGHEEQATPFLTNVARASHLEPGTRSSKDPRCFFLYESYRDKAAFDAHCRSEAYVTHGLRLISERHLQKNTNRSLDFWR